MKKRLVTSALAMLLVLSMVGCSSSKSNIPEKPEEIISKARTNMESSKNFTATSTFAMGIDASGEAGEMTFTTKTTAFKSPFKMKSEVTADMGEGDAANSEMICDKEDAQYYVYSLYNDAWTKDKVEQTQVDAVAEKYKMPVDLDTYVKNPASLKITGVDKENKNLTVLEGTISGEDAVNVLGNSGVLTQLGLTTVPDEIATSIQPITIKIWVNNSSVIIEKFSVDMKTAMQSLIDAIAAEGNTDLGVSITKCETMIDNIVLNKAKDFKVAAEGVAAQPSATTEPTATTDPAATAEPTK